MNPRRSFSQNPPPLITTTEFFVTLEHEKPTSYVSSIHEEDYTLSDLKLELEKIIGKQQDVGWTIAIEKKGKVKVKSNSY